MATYIHQRSDWPDFTWDHEHISPLLAHVRHGVGRLLGRMENYGFHLQEEASLDTLTLDVVKSSEIEGEMLNANEVRSSIARRLGIGIAGLVPSDRHVDGVVEMMLDATQDYSKPLTDKRLFSWHAALFPGGYSDTHKIVVGVWRDNLKSGPMQVVSGASGREVVHFQAPDADILNTEMKTFLLWFNNNGKIDPVLKAAIAHLWFVTIHPFDDGNGRIARAITDMLLARADGGSKRFYSMSAQIRVERKAYYDILEATQKDDLNITDWLEWFLNCLEHSLLATSKTLEKVISKAKFWERSAAALLNERQKKMMNKLLDGFEGKLTSSKWAVMAKCSQDTAVRDIHDLIERRLLVKEQAGGRSTSYVLQLN